MVLEIQNYLLPQRTSLVQRFGSLAISVTLALSLNLSLLKAGYCDDVSKSSELPADLTEIGLEHLLSLDLVVTSPSKKEQRVGDVAAAIYVLSGEEIRRSGVTNVADALRLIPGVNVARISARQWAVSVRGFNQEFSNKLLVLVDGQSIFSPFFNGVYWQLLDLVLEDIDRIEVIRGPGAAIWGANAVNGVINIIRKSSKDTKGVLASVGSGNEEPAMGTFRYGGKFDEKTTYRAFGQTHNYSSFDLKGGGSAADHFNISSAGFRVDSSPNAQDTFTGIADTSYQSENFVVDAPTIDEPFHDTDTFSGNRNQLGARVSGVWQHIDDGGNTLQVRPGHIFEYQESNLLTLTRQTFNIDAQQQRHPLEGHDVIFGLGYRLYTDDFEGTFPQSLDTRTETNNLYTGFAQDEISLVPNTLIMTLGSKVEHDPYTGWEFMPNARLLGKINSRNSVWAAVSRAVAAPSRAFDSLINPLDAFVDPASKLPVVVTAYGNHDVDSEELLAYEAGFRSQVTDSFSFDLSVYYNDYDRILSLEGKPPLFGNLPNLDRSVLIVPLQFDNKLSGRTLGGELSAQYSPSNWLHLVGSYSCIVTSIDQNDSNDAIDPAFIEGSTPKHMATLRSSINFSSVTTGDVILRYVDNLSLYDIDNYLQLDARIGWLLEPGLELSLVGQNLLKDTHQEFKSLILRPRETEVPRAAYVKLTWQY